MPDSALAELRGLASICELCGLCEGRTQAVFDDGSPGGRLMIVGEAPGEQEDARGVPFVGPSGELLNRMIAGMKLSRDEDVYITNAVKCRPPGNRAPLLEEIEACGTYLEAQIELVQPAVILALGRTAMLAVGLPFKERWRGRWARVHGGIPAMATYHPAYLLRNPEAKKVVGEDLAAVVSVYAKYV